MIDPDDHKALLEAVRRNRVQRKDTSHCDLCDVDLKCIQLVQYYPDGYDYLICADCARKEGVLA